ncbi:MFS family permease [Dyadobacter sp. BE34]|uniref:MFS family permease n=1 Tax=Dyadobacter fermentans TaxID=94254 RepID=A0ABU1QTJ5_9BACT|nr:MULTISPECIES: MFS transporter [Dyadobacter]MDR6804065.1 MFS family permease [Dyadobacter fermentans]MDR7041805.1 MFS family permease [Dyadobacter sp. BE242]MDR7196208.1 MFS family permease [Dyadobacter sp. BE34]MDR7213247.1 MFS family permease [Dyadobacter sp. BE31]MDR7261614.1 MFS family permease [Dyadobacter sp. BE32]
MSQSVNSGRLFNASCFALITTAFSFSIRAGILPQLGTEFNLTAEQLGFINSMWFFGFPLAMIIGGLVYHTIGPKTIMQVAFVCHAIGIIMTIYSGGYTGLLISTFLIGVGNGCTEAACNPMIADSYEGLQMSKMLNRFHMWFPGGIVVGSLISKFMTDSNLGWQAQIWVILIPTIIYAFLFWGQAFPKPHVDGVTSIGENLKAMASPLFIFIFVCMAFTAISEFGPQQWTGLIMSKSGASPMLILALVTGLMAITRFFAHPIVAAIGQTGILWGSSILAAAGIYLFSTVTGPAAYAAAVIFAMGVALFWPTMIGFVAQNVPLSGALGMSIVGGIGMFSTAIWQPVIGKWLDDAKAEKLAAGLTGDEMELAAGQATLSTMVMFPALLIVAFAILYFWMKGRKTVTTSSAAVH